MGDSARFRRNGKASYTVPHDARCKCCGETRRFLRHPTDPNRGRTGHLKHMRCDYCKRVTPHIQLGEVTS